MSKKHPDPSILKVHPKTGRPIYPRRKRNPPTGIPSPKEWQGLSRKMFNNLNKQLDAVDDKGIPTCPPQLYTVLAKLIQITDTVVKDDKSKHEISKLEQQIAEKRSRRKLRIFDTDVPETPPVTEATTLINNSRKQVDENLGNPPGTSNTNSLTPSFTPIPTPRIVPDPDNPQEEDDVPDIDADVFLTTPPPWKK